MVEVDICIDLVEVVIVGENGNVLVVSIGCDNIKLVCVEFGSVRIVFS